VERSGIQVDSRLRTSHKHIYAAGDVNGGYQFTHAAGYEGRNVKLSTIAGAIHPYPTIGEINKRMAGTYLSPKIFSPVIVQKGLNSFFNLKGRACHPEQ